LPFADSNMKSHRREMSEETRKGKYFPLATNRFPTNSQPESTHSAIENILRNKGSGIGLKHSQFLKNIIYHFAVSIN